MTEHLPDQATWGCSRCHGSWPCRTAPAGLLDEQNPQALGMGVG